MEMNDRERILMNIACYLAKEVAVLHRLPAVQQYKKNEHALSYVNTESRFLEEFQLRKGDLVLCETSAGRQENPFLISFVENEIYVRDERGPLLRSPGTDELSYYGNESFMRITGIPERLLWSGERQKFNKKLQKALAKLDTYFHRFRGLEFVKDGEALVWFGEIFGGLGKPSKPYSIRILYDKRTTIKGIIFELEAQGFGTREFEREDGSETTYGNPKPITRESLVGTLKSAGVEIGRASCRERV